MNRALDGVWGVVVTYASLFGLLLIGFYVGESYAQYRMSQREYSCWDVQEQRICYLVP